MQILPLWDGWQEMQVKHLRMMIRGPGGWIPAAWFTRPTLCVHMPSTMVDLELFHRAALITSACGTLRSSRTMALEIDAIASADDLHLRHPWHRWLFEGIPHVLRDAAREADGLVASSCRTCLTRAKVY